MVFPCVPETAITVFFESTLSCSHLGPEVIFLLLSSISHQVRLKIAGAELNISAEDVDFSNKAEERLTCEYNGEDIEIGFNSRFLIEMTNNLECKDVKLEMSLPNRAGILKPLDGYTDDEELIMLVMPVMLNN